MPFDNTKTTKLPKPVTVVGSDFPDPNPVDDVANSTDGENDLPMPAVVYEEEEDEQEPSTHDQAPITPMLQQAPLTNLMPAMNPTTSDLVSSVPTDSPVVASTSPAIDDALPSVVLPPLPDITPIDLPSENKVDTQVQPETTQIPNMAVESDMTEPESTQTPMINQSPIQTDFDIPQVPLSSPIQQVPAEINALGSSMASPDSLITQTTPQIPNYSQSVSQTSFDSNLQVPPPPKSTNPMGKVMLGIGLFLIGGGVVVGGYFGITSLNKKDAQPTMAYQSPATPLPTIATTPTVTASPSGTPKSSIVPKASPKTTPKATVKAIPKADTNDEAIMVSILNGSGTKGDALVAKNLIQTSELDITTGNADNFDYVGTSIAYKKGQETTAAGFAKLLEKTYGKVTTEATLTASDEYDLVITVGSRPTSASPTPKPSSTPNS